MITQQTWTHFYDDKLECHVVEVKEPTVHPHTREKSWREICRVQGTESDAIARLISTAPQLLFELRATTEVLQELQKNGHRNWGVNDVLDQIATNQSIIRRATVEQSQANEDQTTEPQPDQPEKGQQEPEKFTVERGVVFDHQDFVEIWLALEGQGDLMRLVCLPEDLVEKNPIEIRGARVHSEEGGK